MEKICCLICKKEFKRVCTHVRQVHKMTAREYKQMFGLDLKRGLLTEEGRAHMREITKENGTIENLKKGASTRFFKGQPGLGKFPRSQQTKDFLGQLHKLVTNHRKERFPKKCEYCGKDFEVVKSHMSKRFCSHSCFMKHRFKHLAEVK